MNLYVVERHCSVRGNMNGYYELSTVFAVHDTLEAAKATAADLHPVFEYTRPLPALTWEKIVLNPGEQVTYNSRSDADFWWVISEVPLNKNLYPFELPKKD